MGAEKEVLYHIEQYQADFWEKKAEMRDWLANGGPQKLKDDGLVVKVRCVELPRGKFVIATFPKSAKFGGSNVLLDPEFFGKVFDEYHDVVLGEMDWEEFGL